MACYNYNGQTFVNTCIPAPGATATDATYVVDLTHYLCGNRKVCANATYPVTGDLKYRVIGGPQPVGNDTYVVDVLITGSVTYMPYLNGSNRCGCGCNCPKTDNVWATVSVPWGSETAPAVTEGDVLAGPTNLRDCCNVTNAVSLTASFNLATAQAASSSGSKKA
jgi:hypothetical protein